MPRSDPQLPVGRMHRFDFPAHALTNTTLINTTCFHFSPSPLFFPVYTQSVDPFDKVPL